MRIQCKNEKKTLEMRIQCKNEKKKNPRDEDTMQK